MIQRDYLLANARPSMHGIFEAVCAKHQVQLKDLQCEQRHRSLVIARQEAMYRAHREGGYSLPRIGRALGNRDHTTVLHGVRRHEKRMKEEAANEQV